MDGEQEFDSFHLHHDDAGDKKVQPISAVESDCFVIDVQRLLPFERDLPERKLVRQTLFVSRFQ